jgi:hypothetical protein
MDDSTISETLTRRLMDMSLCGVWITVRLLRSTLIVLQLFIMKHVLWCYLHVIHPCRLGAIDVKPTWSRCSGYISPRDFQRNFLKSLLLTMLLASLSCSSK